MLLSGVFCIDMFNATLLFKVGITTHRNASYSTHISFICYSQVEEITPHVFILIAEDTNLLYLCACLLYPAFSLLSEIRSHGGLFNTIVDKID